MLPKYIKVKNFTSYFEETIDFSSFPPLFALIGNNGAGKSSIIDMITTAIFYRARGVDNRGTGMDELINKNTDKFELEFVFTMDNVEYKIIRRKQRNSAHELEFYINGISQTEKLTETQIKIDNVIKMDYDTFLDTVCIGQGQSGRFMKKKPNERKDVFVQVLGLNKYEHLEEYTKDLKKQTKTEIEKLDSKLENLLNLINQEDNYSKMLEDASALKQEYVKQIKIKEEELEKELTEKAKYEQIKKQIDHILNQRTTLEKKITILKNSINENISFKDSLNSEAIQRPSIETKLKEYQIKVEQLQNEYTELSNTKSSLEATNNMLTTQAKEFKNKYDKLKNYNEGNCEFCGHIITNDYKQTYLNDLMVQGKTLMAEIKSNQQKLDKLTQDIAIVYNDLKQTKSAVGTLQIRYNQAVSAESSVKNTENMINKDKIQLREFEIELNKNKEIQVDKIEDRTFNDYAIRNEITQLRQILSKAESDLAIAKNKLVEINNAKGETKQLKDNYDNLLTLYSDYEDLSMAWGKSGIQATIIRNALPEIEIEINRLLNLLCNGKVTVEFNTEKDTKNKKKNRKPTSIETLEIIINDKGESRTYETYSGGEQFRVDFACHVGLAKFLAKRAGATIDFFIVDEGLGSQDNNARQQFVTSVYKLTQTFKQIMCVTHIEELKDAFGGKVEVYRDPLYGSKVRLL